MKIGLIGLNTNEIEKHFSHVHDALGKDLSGIFSPHDDSIFSLCKKNDIKIYTSTNDLFEENDAIYFANSLEPNYNFAISAIKKSCHLFIENISSVNLKEIQYLYKVAFEAGTNIQLQFSKSFLSEYLAVKEYVLNPKLIEATTSFTHFIRIEEYFMIFFNILYLASNHIKSEIRKTSLLATPFNENNFSLVNARISYNNGVVLNIKIANIATNHEETIVFYETGQTVFVNLNKHKSTLNKLENGHTIQQEFYIEQKNVLRTEIENFKGNCQNKKLQNISETPGLLSLIKTSREITKQLTKTIHQI